MNGAALLESITAEITSLHSWFAEWFRAEADAGPFSRFEDAIADGFTLVTPDGMVLKRTEIMTAIRTARGARNVDIWTTDHELIWRGDGVTIVRYVEHQAEDERENARLSTAGFQATEGGLQWLFVHETWRSSDV